MITLSQSLTLASNSPLILPIPPAPPTLSNPFSGAALAFLLRTPKGSSYTGNLIRVRRSSDNAELDIGAFSVTDQNGNRWLNSSDLLSFVGANSGFVVTWYDVTGNGRHVTQGAQAAQPRIVLNGVLHTAAGLPAVTFNNNNWLDCPTALNLAMPTTAFAVVAPTGAPQKIFDAAAGGRQMMDANGTTWRIFGGTTLASSATGTFIANERVVLSAQINGAASSLRKNGTTIISSPSINIGAAVLGNLRLGRSNGTNMDYLSGPFHEFVLFSAALTATQMSDIGKNQGAAFGITVA